MKNILVYGGCVSRDVFNAPYNKGDLNLVGYVARYSIAKLSSKSVTVKINHENLPSPFQRKAVEMDAKNGLFSFVDSRDYDYLLIDFLFTRFKLVEFGGGLLTYSTELRKTKLVKSTHKLILNDSNEYWGYFEKGLDLLLSHLIKIGRIEKLILNKVYLSTLDNTGELFNDVDKKNEILEKAYEIFESKINSEQIIEYERSLFVSDAEHQWGRDPMHYVPQFYEESYRRLSSLSNFPRL